jgi:hypothetical protein
MTTRDLLTSLVHPQKVRLVTIARTVWPDIDEHPTWHATWLLGAVDDVLKGACTPTLSRKEREAVELAAKEIA